jgi:hypothetical protein
MRTIVYQSFRTENVPGWIESCMTTVRAWAEQRGFAYRFWDDRFFDLVPEDIRPRASAYKCVLSDYARLVAAQQLLNEGWDRAIWVDADALVFDPNNFSIETTRGYAFCREVWLDRISFGRPQYQLTVNNSVSVFCQGETLIQFYLDAARRILASNEPLTPVSIGTRWLLGLRRLVQFPLITSVGIFGPEMAKRYMRNDEPFLRSYLAYQTSPIYAANLCLSKVTSGSSADGLREDMAQALIDRLLSDRGSSLNRCFENSYASEGEEFGRPLTTFLGLKTDLKTLVQNSKRHRRSRVAPLV